MNPPKTIVFALHGFLGLPKDFAAFDKALARGIELIAVDYNLIPSLSPAVPLVKWGENFNSWVEDYLEKHSELTAANPRKILLGYSQGGRLALHAIKNQQSLWDQVILVSANPGIAETEKPERRISDQNWALKFSSGNFRSAVTEWNAQGVFKGSEEPERFEEDYKREQLVQGLESWGLSEQVDLRSWLQTVNVPLLWVSGERDTKYMNIAQALSRSNPKIEAIAIKNAGHRVLFDRPDALAALIR